MFNISFTFEDFKRVVWTVIQAGIAGFWLAVEGVGPIHDFNSGKAAIVAGLAGASAGVLSFLKNLLLADTASIK